MSVFWLLILAALFFIVTTPLSRLKRPAAGFDPGEMPAEPFVGSKEEAAESGEIELGGGVYWAPEAHPNPHLLVLGGSGAGKSWTLRLLAEKLMGRGYRCVLLDFHGDLDVEGAASYRIGFDSEFGVNPLAVSLDPEGGGPEPQRFEVLAQLQNAFRPIGPLELALLDECLKATYGRFGVSQDPETWKKEMPHFGHLREELDRRIAAEPKNARLQGLRTKCSPAFEIFNKPQIPYRLGDGPGGFRLDLAKLPWPLQYLAADTFLKQILRGHQLAGIQELSTYLLVDESKLCTPVKKDSPLGALNRLVSEGRKFGLGLVVSCQFFGHLGRDLLVNTFTKIVMKTDKTEISATARRFRLEEAALESLQKPGQALVHFADSNEWKEVEIGSGSERQRALSLSADRDRA